MRRSHNKLLRLSAEKNHQAFKELYDQTSPAVYSLILHFLRRKYLAEEVLQEVYQEVWQSCSTYNHQKCSVITWMLEITKNKVARRLAVKRKCVLN